MTRTPTRTGPVLLGAAAGILLGAGAAVAGAQLFPDPDADRAACLEAALEAAPSWPESGGPVLDGLDGCKTLPAADKTRLRATLAGVGLQR